MQDSYLSSSCICVFSQTIKSCFGSFSYSVPVVYPRFELVKLIVLKMQLERNQSLNILNF